MSDALWERFRDEYRRIRLDFDQYIDAMHLAAETDTNGVMLNRLGRRQGIDARSLFYGPFSRVEKYASEELYAWFEQDEKRRMAWEQFERWMVEMPVKFVLGVPGTVAPSTLGLQPDMILRDGEITWMNREGRH